MPDTSKPHSEQLLVMNLGAKERAEAAVSTSRERGESAKQPSLLTALGHDVLLALAIIERLEEQLEAYRAALQTIADKDLTAHQTRSGAHAYRTTRQFAREVLNPASEPDA